MNDLQRLFELLQIAVVGCRNERFFGKMVSGNVVPQQCFIELLPDATIVLRLQSLISNRVLERSWRGMITATPDRRPRRGCDFLTWPCIFQASPFVVAAFVACFE
jgi:hypothetical protein